MVAQVKFSLSVKSSSKLIAFFSVQVDQAAFRIF